MPCSRCEYYEEHEQKKIRVQKFSMTTNLKLIHFEAKKCKSRTKANKTYNADTGNKSCVYNIRLALRTYLYLRLACGIHDMWYTYVRI